MKKCPFCDWENEDNASKCLACGTELEVNNTEQESVEAETISADMVVKEELYGVVLESADGRNPPVLKVVNKLLNCGLVVAKSKSGHFIVEVGLDKASAEALVDKLGTIGITAKAVINDELPITSEELPQIQAEIKKMKTFITKAPKVNIAFFVIGAVLLSIGGIILAIVLNR